MASTLAKPAIDAGIVTISAEPLLRFYEQVAGMQRLEPLERRAVHPHPLGAIGCPGLGLESRYKQPVRFPTEIGSAGAVETPHEQPRAHEQHH